jgi:7-cyano-7-deazaguanine tRNA-ribosyltransferase
MKKNTKMPMLSNRKGASFSLPIFLPVYHPVESPFPVELWVNEFDVQGCIVNAFFLYKNRDIRKKLEKDHSLHQFVGFPKLVMTDSGAFQGFQGSLYLKNKTIVKFQESIGADIVSPLDLVCGPGESRKIAEKKWDKTLLRIKEAQHLLECATLAGVQQGGKYHDLRQKSTEELMQLNVRYLALGSLVPFFNRNHNLAFVGKVIQDARCVCDDNIPIHVYGAGDPVELPFMVALGANIFDSSSYAHYARQGWYMTPYGATQDRGKINSGEFACKCPYCKQFDKPSQIFDDIKRLTCHNLWTILQTIKDIRMAIEKNALDQHLDHILAHHEYWFPDSALQNSWHALVSE